LVSALTPSTGRPLPLAPPFNDPGQRLQIDSSLAKCFTMALVPLLAVKNPENDPFGVNQAEKSNNASDEGRW
jgi:hypothetical protein